VTRQSTGYDHGMPKLIVSVLTSLDGYYEGPDKDLASMPFEDAFNTHNLGLLQRAGTLVYGSTWFPGNWGALVRRGRRRVAERPRSRDR
jgi:hypothetical protein